MTNVSVEILKYTLTNGIMPLVKNVKRTISSYKAYHLRAKIGIFNELLKTVGEFTGFYVTLKC